ncbi:MAG TPA: hypothetical protein VGT44_06505 [Ktedonobacteraceae bacterium]|nr:hypothetical protein [Ktedonobacteraceae bacterium]
MPNHPEMEERNQPPTSGKLVLPSLPDTPGLPGTFPTPRPYTETYNAQITPAQLIRPKGPAAPHGLLARLAFYWRKDPAYKVFMLAVVAVLLASIVFVSMAGAAWLGKPFFGSPYTQSPPTVTAPTGTVDLHPTFGPPAGGTGSGQSSQPPAQSTPALGNTPTPSGSPSPQPSPTQPGQGGTLTVQITGYLPVVPNNSHVPITVTTNEANVTVNLYMQSNGNPPFKRFGPGITDSSGMVTIDWFVSYFSIVKRTITVSITAIGTDQNGQSIRSAPVMVRVYV